MLLNCDVVVTWLPPSTGRRPAAYAVLRDGHEVARVPAPSDRFTDPDGGAARAYQVTALDRGGAAAGDPAAVDAGTLLSFCLRLGQLTGGSGPAASAASERRADLQVVVRLVSEPVVAVGGLPPGPASPATPGVPPPQLASMSPTPGPSRRSS
jgi:hypothetical protein